MRHLACPKILACLTDAIILATAAIRTPIVLVRAPFLLQPLINPSIATKHPCSCRIYILNLLVTTFLVRYPSHGFRSRYARYTAGCGKDFCRTDYMWHPPKTSYGIQRHATAACTSTSHAWKQEQQASLWLYIPSSRLCTARYV